MSADSATGPPDPDEFQAFYDYLRVADAHRADPRAWPAGGAELRRANQLTQQSCQAVERQIARIRYANLLDPASASQATVDARFLIAALWLLRSAGYRAAMNEAPPGGPLTLAIAVFDAQLPDLGQLHQATLDLTEPLADRRTSDSCATRPGAHRAPEVETISRTHFEWCGGTIDFDAALTASGLLAVEVHAALRRSQSR